MDWFLYDKEFRHERGGSDEFSMTSLRRLQYISKMMSFLWIHLKYHVFDVTSLRCLKYILKTISILWRLWDVSKIPFENIYVVSKTPKKCAVGAVHRS